MEVTHTVKITAHFLDISTMNMDATREVKTIRAICSYYLGISIWMKIEHTLMIASLNAQREARYVALSSREVRELMRVISAGWRAFL